MGTTASADGPPLTPAPAPALEGADGAPAPAPAGFGSGAGAEAGAGADTGAGAGVAGSEATGSDGSAEAGEAPHSGKIPFRITWGICIVYATPNQGNQSDSDPDNMWAHGHTSGRKM